MATQSNELFSSADGNGSGLRVEPITVQPKLFADPGASDVALAKLTPVAFNTSTQHWVVWDQDGTNGANIIRGFIWPDAATLDADGESIHNVLLEGKIHYDDLPAATDVDANATVAGWRLALNAASAYGLIVQGIPAGAS